MPDRPDGTWDRRSNPAFVRGKGCAAGFAAFGSLQIDITHKLNRNEATPEAILKPHCIQGGMPILTYESDGYAAAPSFLRQVEVHIQQALQHAATKRRAPSNGGRIAALLESLAGKLR